MQAGSLHVVCYFSEDLFFEPGGLPRFPSGKRRQLHLAQRVGLGIRGTHLCVRSRGHVMVGSSIGSLGLGLVFSFTRVLV